jgi:putative transposon-encoded protein
MRTIDLNKGNLHFKDKIEGFLERIVTPIGNSGKADIPKRFIGRKVYVLISQNESKKRSKSLKRRA